MKKFERLSPEERRQEIQTAALALFQQKGFAATTMENIVANVTLSKGGVYRIYPSTQAILQDLILGGMRLRNAWYEQQVSREIAEGRPLTLAFLVDMIAESLLLYPEISGIYAEFLWEKQRNPQLQALYEQVCHTTVEETDALIRKYGAEEILQPGMLEQLTELMNGAVLSLRVLDGRKLLIEKKSGICRAILGILME